MFFIEINLLIVSPSKIMIIDGKKHNFSVTEQYLILKKNKEDCQTIKSLKTLIIKKLQNIFYF